MKALSDSLGSEPLHFYLIETVSDVRTLLRFIAEHTFIALDTESTGIRLNDPEWELRSIQIGDGTHCFIIDVQHATPERADNIRSLLTERIFTKRHVRWIGHNIGFDWRCIERFIGHRLSCRYAHDTAILTHFREQRKRDQGGINHKLEERAVAYVHSDSKKWSTALHKEYFPTLRDENGKRLRTKAECWKHYDVRHPIVLRYAAADVILAWRLWAEHEREYAEYREVYEGLDLRVARVCDELARRTLPVDIEYTKRYDRALLNRAAEIDAQIETWYGSLNVGSNDQLTELLLSLGAPLSKRTARGKCSADSAVLEELHAHDAPYAELCGLVLERRRVLKRSAAYTTTLLSCSESDERGVVGVNPSINPVAARTWRMSVASPPLQQMPTIDQEGTE